MIKGFLKYFLLFVIACAGAVAIYYYAVDENDRIPIGIEITK